MQSHKITRYLVSEARPMLRLAVPIVLAEIGWMTMGIVDTMMVGRQAESSVAIAAVSLGGVIYNAVAIFGTGLMLGLDTLVSHSYGAGDLEEVHHLLVNGVYLTFGIGPLLILIVRFCELLMRSVGAQPAVLDQAIPYLRAVNWSTLPLLFYFTFRRYLQGIDLAKPVMFSLISANVVNLVGNWALVFGHLGFRAMGTVGSGWSTCIARTYMAAMLLGYCVYYEWRFKAGLRNVRRWPHMPRVWRVLKLGFPAAMQLGLEVTIFAVATALIARLGAVALAGHQVALNTVSFTYMVPLGISSAAAVRVGQAIGRRDPEGASRAGWTALALGSAFMSCTAVAFWLWPKYIVRLYTPDPRVLQVATRLLAVAAFFQLFDGLQVVATGALRGVGDTRTPMIWSSSVYWIIGLPVGTYLCFGLGWGAQGMWIGLCIALIVVGSGLLYFWHRKEKTLARVLTAVLPAAVNSN